MIRFATKFAAPGHLPLMLALFVAMTGCTSVDKNSDEKFQPTNADGVKLIQVTPYRSFEKIGTVDARWFDTSDAEEMYSSIREQAAAEGADAVIIKDEGTESAIMLGNNLWAQGVAIRYNGAN